MEEMFLDESVVSWKEGGEGCRPYVASPQNTKGDGSLCNVTLPHPPAPVLHKHRGLVAAPVWPLHNSKAHRTLSTLQSPDYVCQEKIQRDVSDRINVLAAALTGPESV